jgi:uncharacterized protein (TIGR03437 family)
LFLTLTSPPGNQPAAIQWTLSYPAPSVVNFAVTAGPALTAAGKILNCSANSGAYTCIAAGINANLIANGIVGIVTLAAPAIPVSIGVGALAATLDGRPIATVSTGGTATGIETFQAASLPSALSCTAASLAPGASTACTLTLTSPVPDQTTIALNSTGSITVPAAVLIAAHATSAAFTVTAGAFAADQTATVTAILNGVSTTISLSLVAPPAVTPPAVTSLLCTYNSLAASSVTPCTLTLSKPAPGGGINVPVSSSAPAALSVPASVFVAAERSTAAFNATAADVSSDQSATITASLNGSAVSVTVTVIASVPIPSSLVCSSTALSPNTRTNCVVGLNRAAPQGGTLILLSNSAPFSLSVPDSVTVPAGATLAEFSISTGTTTTGESATIRAQVGQAAVSLTITFPQPAAPPPATSLLSQLACSLLYGYAGPGGMCTVTLSAPSVEQFNVTMGSSSPGLVVPASVIIVPGTTSTTFFFPVSPDWSGTATISATLGTVTRTVTITSADPTASPAATSSQLRLRCDRQEIAAGGHAVCEILYSPRGREDATAFSLSSTSARVKAPASVQGRAGRNAVRFEVSADEEASQENVTIQAQAGAAHAQASLLVVSQGSLHLRVPHRLTTTPGSPVRFNASAADEEDLPVSVTVAGMPAGARFETASGLYEWTPADRDLGPTEISFTARNSLDMTVTKTVTIYVVPAQPVLTQLRNGAGSGAVAACSPGALATLVGTSLAGSNPTARVRVLVNGNDASVIRASDRQVQFLCPALATGTPMAIAAEVGGRTSNQLRTVMRQTAPGLLSADGSGTGQGLVLHARGLAALPRFDRAGTPVVAGDAITLLATGIACDETPGAPPPLLYMDHIPGRIAGVSPSAFPGVCEVHAIIPSGLSGDDVGIYLESVGEDGSFSRSNTLLLAVEE